MTSGAYKNYDELEDSLTLTELLEIDKAITRRDWKLIRMIGAANGADMPFDPFSSPEEEVTVGDIAARAASKSRGALEGVPSQLHEAVEVGFGYGSE